MIATSIAIPTAASWHWSIGWARLPGLARDVERAPFGQPKSPLALPYPTIRGSRRYGPTPRPLEADVDWCPRAIFFDRDGTLVIDVPYNGNPAVVAPMPGARQALRRARKAGLRLAAITNQSGVAGGRITMAEVQRVNSRVEEVVGRLEHWAICPHGPSEGCGCRKPAPGLVKEAAAKLDVDPSACAVIGDTAADIEAAAAAGARAVLVPTRVTRPREIRAARQVAPDLLTAVDLVLSGRC